MNYADCLKELIQAYPLKEQTNKYNAEWVQARQAHDDIIARFDTEILTMANLAIKNIELSTNYLLVVGTRFGIETCLDRKNPELHTISYYLKTGIMYGPSTAKKSQFAFEIMAHANKNGIKIIDDVGIRATKGETGIIFSELLKILTEYYTVQS